MTRLAAKGIWLAVLVSFITSKRAGGDEKKRNQQKHEEGTARVRLIEIELWIGSNFRWCCLVPAPAFDHSAGNHNQQSKDQNWWKDDVSEDAEIRVLLFRRDLNEKQQHHTDQRCAGDRGAHETNVVAE